MILLLFPLVFASLTTAIWPAPAVYEHGNDVVWITRDTEFKWAGAGKVGYLKTQEPEYPFEAIPNHPQNIIHERSDKKRVHLKAPTGKEMVEYAIKSAKHTLFNRNFVPWKFHPRNWTEPVFDASISKVYLELLGQDPEDIAKPLAGVVDESYQLTLTEDSKNWILHIAANSSVGIVRGLTTLTQLFFASENSPDGHAYTTSAPVRIFDAPKFEHRGVNLDVSRHYFAPSDIKRTIDAMAYNKLNRFHLHVTDGQSWPLVIPALPELSAKGAYRPNQIYSPSVFNELQYYASIHGVELITEIDMPGHTSSIAHSYPELIASFDKQPNWDTYAAEPPSGTLKLNSPAVFKFLETLLNDLLPRVFPYSSYFHTGGDEVNKNAYKLDETVQSSDPAILQPLMQKFIDRNHDHVRRAGLTPIVWEEMLLEWNLTLGKDVIIQSWRSDEAVAQITAKGHKAIVGNYNYWYLDCGKGQWLNFDPSISASQYPYLDYCGPYHNWRLIYSYDPLTSVAPENQHLILGGETHLWAEQADASNVDGMLWPRAAAAAEILWSGAKDAQGRNRSQIDAAPRLSEMRERLVARGVAAEPIQMPYCTMEGMVCQLGYTP
ncbi:glycoside hydrolase family 20 protein [Periconia macrospinosa]|uniref:Beta-hexosaminidase n=1 Tax=Periconia macrospinosa TaxID=97972 RepID=A0A2V1DQP3_9PLEO|nr:glycoside hydrolase family 20 protein [Periconia macrospinosa]